MLRPTGLSPSVGGQVRRGALDRVWGWTGGAGRGLVAGHWAVRDAHGWPRPSPPLSAHRAGSAKQGLAERGSPAPAGTPVPGGTACGWSRRAAASRGARGSGPGHRQRVHRPWQSGRSRGAEPSTVPGLVPPGTSSASWPLETGARGGDTVGRRRGSRREPRRRGRRGGNPASHTIVLKQAARWGRTGRRLDGEKPRGSWDVFGVLPDVERGAKVIVVPLQGRPCNLGRSPERGFVNSDLTAPMHIPTQPRSRPSWPG